MPYQFTCPLCLVTLGPGHSLRLFKIADAGSHGKGRFQPIDCGNPNFIGNILKFSGEDTFVPIDDYAVYVSHEKCEASNPFWATDKLDMPGKYSDGEQFTANLTCVTTEKQFQRALSYWMVKILRETAKVEDKYRPMWYPLQLLLATAADSDPRIRPYGSLVEMASSKSVGKTILTLQILNQALYKNHREVTVRDFFYPNADLESVDSERFREKFYNEVFYHSMWKSMPISRPFGTVPSAGDLRAIFVKPAAAKDRPVQIKGRQTDGRFRRWVLTPLSIFIGETFGSEEKQNDEQPAPDFDDLLRKHKEDYWSPIIFYDTAGELQQTMGPVTRSVRNLTNKLAICVDAREIFNRYEPFMPEETVTPVTERNASIRHAHRRLEELENAPKRKKPACIIVTKLDVVLSQSDQEKVRAIAEDPNADESDEAARKLLSAWLKTYSDSDKENLRSFLAKDRGAVEKVFFVWTENLPRMKGVRRSPIKRIEPASARRGEEITLEADTDFDFQDVKKVTFNGIESSYRIESNQTIKATVPETATSGLVGILLEGKKKQQEMVAAKSDTYKDDATSDVAFIVLPETSSDASRPRSYGLIKFLAWCLDRPIEEISRPTNNE